MRSWGTTYCHSDKLWCEVGSANGIDHFGPKEVLAQFTMGEDGLGVEAGPKPRHKVAGHRGNLGGRGEGGRGGRGGGRGRGGFITSCKGTIL